MPNRIIREGICTSDTINALEPAEEVFFYRLLVVADDFGRFDGRLAILKSECFPLRDGVKPAAIDGWLRSLVREGLVVRYEVDGKPYLEICKWLEHQRMRNMRSKYPAPVDSEPPTVASNPPSIDRESPTVDGNTPPVDTKPPQSAARAGAESESESESESEAEQTKARQKAGAPSDWIPPEAWERWQKHRGRKLTPQAATLQIRKLERLRCDGHDPTAVIDLAIESGWATFYPPKVTGPPGKQRQREQTLAERRVATIDAITGRKPQLNERDITASATRVDSATVHPLSVGVREPSRDDVGAGGPGGPAANVG